MPKHSDRRTTLCRAQIGPPPCGCLKRPRGSVATLAQATSLRCASRLPTQPLQAITTMQPHVIWF